VNGPTQILERSAPNLYPEAIEAARITVGHAEGMLIAFANIYRALHRKISGSPGQSSYPAVEDGVKMVRAVHAAVESGNHGGAWVDV
jgi:hypothetical protein